MQFLFVLLVFGPLTVLAGVAFFFWAEHGISGPWVLNAGPTIAAALRRRHWRIFLGLAVFVAATIGLELLWQGFHDFVGGVLDRLAEFFSSDPLDRGRVSILFFTFFLAAILAGMLAGSWRACRRSDRMKCVGFVDLVLGWRH